jgi:hypothetical protein
METIATLLPYRVTLKEDAGDKFTVAFDCQAEDTDHAEEQAENAYPGCEIVNITQMEPRPLGLVPVSLAAVAVCHPEDLHPEDEHVQGVYLMEVQEWLGPEYKASAALDRFHSELPVKELDNFQFFVFNADTGMVMEPDENEMDYALIKSARFIDKVCDAVPKLFLVDLKSDEPELAGTYHVAADSQEEANAKALAELCGNKVDPKAISAKFNTSLL